MELTEGKIIAEHYKLVKQLGHGSFGNVWLAHNLLADIDVAVKFYGALDQNGLDEFRQEFKIAYALRHPNLLNINHFDVYENCPYLVMPYCANGSVSSKLGKMPESELWKFAADVSNGLAFLHTVRPPIIHQDIKPDNILMTSDGRYVITDFGISHSFRTKLSKTNTADHSSGTLAYMGPERFAKKPIIVLASDIWAFGATLYELMENALLWEGMGGCAQLNGAALPEIEGNYSQPLIQLVEACLAAETWKRPTAEAIHDYATAYIQHKPLPKLCPDVDQPAVPTGTKAPSGQTQPNESSTVDHRHDFEASETHYNPSHNTGYTPSYVSPHRAYASEPQYQQSSVLRGSWKKWAAIAAACVCAILLLTGITRFIMHIREEQQFISCKSPQDFEQFIKDHPNSPYADKARRQLAGTAPAALTAPGAATTSSAAVEPVRQQPAISSTEKKTSKTTHEYVSPGNNKSQRATSTTNQRVQTEPNDPARHRDDQAYFSCRTLEDFNSYLNNFPNGAHRQEARTMLNIMAKERNNSQQPQQYGTVVREAPPVEQNYHVRNPQSAGQPGISTSSSRNINIGINFNTSGMRGPRGPMGGSRAGQSQRGGNSQRGGGGHTGRNER